MRGEAPESIGFYADVRVDKNEERRLRDPRPFETRLHGPFSLVDAKYGASGASRHVGRSIDGSVIHDDCLSREQA